MTLFDADDLRERLRQWRLFNEWEQEHGDVPVAVEDLVRWYSEVWELSHRYSRGGRRWR